MKTIKKIIAIMLLSLAEYEVFAQQDPMVDQYMFNQLYINPAYAGSHPYTNATLLYRNQWINFPGAPVTEILSMDGSLDNNKVGLGFSLLNDHIGVSSRTGFQGDYSYHLKLNDKQVLGMGLSGGLDYYQAQLTDLIVWDQGDNVFTSNINSKLIPSFGTGLYLTSKLYYLGLSIPNILSYTPNTFLYLNLGNEPEFQRHYYLTGGYSYIIDPKVILKPFILLKYTKNVQPEADFNFNVLFDSVVTIGASYRTSDSFLGMIQFTISKNFRIGYAYDYPFTDLRHYSSGSQEIMLSYDLGKAARKNGKGICYCY